MFVSKQFKGSKQPKSDKVIYVWKRRTPVLTTTTLFRDCKLLNYKYIYKTMPVPKHCWPLRNINSQMAMDCFPFSWMIYLIFIYHWQNFYRTLLWVIRRVSYNNRNYLPFTTTFVSHPGLLVESVLLIVLVFCVVAFVMFVLILCFVLNVVIVSSLLISLHLLFTKKRTLISHNMQCFLITL